ncbi:RNA 2'-phosphotransferase [Anaerolineales bacterium HSG24]|nr:RNA 2'-phosphotransferase [Anaerolineales bacterium HSG24]
MRKKLVRLSKFISLVLRHKPESAGLQLDPAGWVEVEALLNAAKQANLPLDMASLEQVVIENDKQRFAFSPDKQRIRANHGHSIPVELDLSPRQPPDRLFHGTATRFLSAIKTEGLMSQGRLYVHLSSNQEMAYKVGRRHGKPSIITVQAGQMAQDGHQFYCSASNIWLTNTVPIQYLEFDET